MTRFVRIFGDEKSFFNDLHLKKLNEHLNNTYFIELLDLISRENACGSEWKHFFSLKTPWKRSFSLKFV